MTNNRISTYILIRKALANEKAVDHHVARRYLSSSELEKIPNFKQLKMLDIYRKLGPLFKLALWCVLIALPISACFIWFSSLLINLLRFKPRPQQYEYLYVGFFERHVNLINQALKGDGIQLENVGSLRRRDILKELPFGKVLDAIWVHYLLLTRILFKVSKDRASDILHTYNAFDLIVLCIYGQEMPSKVFVTSDIYQRWAFILGHGANRCWMVQHGYIDEYVSFPFNFHDVERIYIFTDKHRKSYRNYYDAADFVTMGKTILFREKAAAGFNVLLASSYPYIEKEIQLCRLLKETLNVSLSIKKHPRHVYDRRLTVLMSYADHVIPPDEDYKCDVFVSYKSTYEVHYQGIDIPTASIMDCGSVEKTVKKIGTIKSNFIAQ